MANAIYDIFKEHAMEKTLFAALTAANIKVVAVDTSGGTPYTFSQSHDFLADVASGSRRFTSGNLANATVVGKTFDADNLVPAFASAASGEAFEAIILYIDSTVEATSNLIIFIDTATGLPLTPDGNNINLNWNGTGIFQL